MTARPSLEEARSRLRELGYLDAGVERLLFKPVFEWRGSAFLPAVILGAFAAALAAVAAADAAEPGFGSSPSSAAVLFLHIFLADLLPAAILAFGLAKMAERSRSPGSAATLAGLGAAALVFLLWLAGTYALARELSPRALLWGVPIAISALLLAAAARLAFLAKAFERSGALPSRGARRVFALAAAAGLLTAGLLFFWRREPPPPVPPPHPAPRSVPVVVLAIDGLDLDSSGKGTRAAALLAGGSTGWWPAYSASPPEIWTTIASGVSPRRHGVRALARLRPIGSSAALRPPFGTAWYLRRLGRALRLVSNVPISGADRRSLDFWEVAASAGIPSLSVGWWAAAPWPGATVVENRAIFSRSRDAVDADRIALASFEAAAEEGFGVQTVYLPGCDIARSDAVRRAAVLGRLEPFLSRRIDLARGGRLVLAVVAADSHPSPGSLARLVVFDRGGPRRTVRIRPEDVTPSILARAGVPAAGDLEGRPVAALFSPDSLDRTTVATYGPRVLPAAAPEPESDREYLEKLRSLGYLK